METSEARKSFRVNLVVVTLVLVSFLGYSLGGFSSTLLVDLARTFKVTVGTLSQLEIINLTMGLAVGFVMGFLALKFKYKSIYLVGIALFAVGTIGFFFSQSFFVFLLWHFVLGVGSAMFGIIGLTLVGEFIPLKRRGWVMGLMTSSIWVAFVVVGPLSGIIDSLAGWRAVLLWFILPCSLLCFGLSFVSIPSKQLQELPPIRPSYSQAFQQVFLNKSAIACVVANALSGFLAILGLYGVSFYRISFNISPLMGGAFAAVAFGGGIFGGLVGGRSVNRVGRKYISVLGYLIAGALGIIFTFVPDAWFSLGLWSALEFCVAMGLAGALSLTIEQVPGSRASMMSVNYALTEIGWISALIIGGLVLNLYLDNFHLLMTILGAGGVAAGLIFLFLTKDTCKIS